MRGCAAARLRDLREAGFVDLQRPQGYGLAPLGRELQTQFLPLYRFAERWAVSQRAGSKA